VDFDVIVQLIITWLAFIRFCKKIGAEWDTALQLFIDCNKSYYYIRIEVLYNICIEFTVPLKLGLIKTCLNETCSKYCLVNFL
jgi:hypothetical protein